MISPNNTQQNHACVLIVGAGPAGLSAAIRLKTLQPDADVVVLDKSPGPGNHTLSGAVLEVGPLAELLNDAQPDWRHSEDAKAVLGRTVTKDEVMFFATRSLAMTMMPAIKAARLCRLGFGQMIHAGDAIISVAELTVWLARIAESLGIEVLHGFGASEIIFNDASRCVTGVKMVDQGLDHEGNPQPNYLPGETFTGDAVVLAEGCCGLLTEQLVEKAGLQRKRCALYSVGVKELIEVSPAQYQAFTDGRVLHAMGYPIWTPFLGPSMFGGGIMYPFGNNHIAVGMIVGADWKYADFNPQDALVEFKKHARVRKYIEGGTVVEAGAKMIPEGGYFAIPRDPSTNAIGVGNVCIVGDSAGFVNMLKIKGLHNAIASGALAGRAIADSLKRSDTQHAADTYTRLWEDSPVKREMYSARNFRQTVAKLGNTVGLGLSVLQPILPKWRVEKDYEAMKRGCHYKYAGPKPFDKDTFVAKAGVEHREEQPSHCHVIDPKYCLDMCPNTYGRPCITFCPAGVYELIQGVMKPANPSNCLHCKTCENKCPYDNLHWTTPEGAGGPHYAKM